MDLLSPKAVFFRPCRKENRPDSSSPSAPAPALVVAIFVRGRLLHPRVLSLPDMP